MKFDEYFKLKDLTLNITNYCNMKECCGDYCSYCFENHRNKDMMKEEQFKQIIDKCYQNHIKYYEDETLLVNLFGGEPFANWKLIEYALKYSKEQNYNIEYGVTTNLIHLTDHMIDVIEEYELGLLVSIDGIRDIHNRNRSNSYDLVKNNIQRLVERGLKHLIEVRMTVMPSDVDYLLESIQSIVDMGIVNIAPVPVSDTKWLETDYERFKFNLSKVWDWIIQIYNDDDNKQNITIKFIEDYLEKVLVFSLESEIKHCLAGKNTNCSIGVNGEIYPCHQRHTIENNNSKLLFGNFFVDDIHDIDFNNKTTKAPFNCKDCVAFSTCQGGCPSENLTQNGDSNVMNETQCRLVQAMVEVALKYQYEIMKSTNIRSKRLNTIKINMELMNYLIMEVLTKEFNSKEYNLALISFYEKLIDYKASLLPQFEDIINNIITELKNINNLMEQQYE